MEGINRNKLKGLRVEHGLTQKDMADKLEMPLSTYCSKEQGKNEFTESEVLKISIFFMKTIEYFFSN